MPPVETILNIFGEQALVKLSGRDSNGQFAVLTGVTPPGVGPPLHRHSREDEFFYVLEGQYRFQEGDRKFSAGAGDTVFLPRGTSHTYKNVGSGPGRLLVVVQPAGFDEFLRELSDVTSHMAEPDMGIVIPLFQKYGLELLGPPIPG